MGSLTLKNVHKSFGKVKVLKGIDLEVSDGEFVVFVGPSGCGKSTLLRIIAGLEDATEGAVEIDGETVNLKPPSKRGIAMVFQTYALYPHLTVRGNMSLGLKQAGRSRAEIEERVKMASAMLSLDDYLERRPAELSGGQRQRVAIGRAIVRKPKLFLFDEPLSNLDAALRVNTRIEIAQLHRKLGATIVYVTHDQTEAMTMADRIVVLHDGVISQEGTPMELYNAPANRFVAGFIGSPKMNFIAAGVIGEGGGAAEIGIRPEHITVTREGGAGDLRGAVSHVEHLGAETNLYLQTEKAGLLTIRMFGEHRFTIGETLHARLDPAHIYRFDEKGRTLE